MNIESLQNYFDDYNKIVRGVEEGRAGPIETFNLLTILESIDGVGERSRESGYGMAHLWNMQVLDAEHRFCRAVAYHFIAMQKCPDLSPKTVVSRAKELGGASGHYAHALNELAAKIEDSYHKDMKTINPSTSLGNQLELLHP